MRGEGLSLSCRIAIAFSPELVESQVGFVESVVGVPAPTANVFIC